MLPEDFRIEPYGIGFMLADYSGTFAEARYCGVSMDWRIQPICNDPFPTKEAAKEARDKFIASVI